MGDVVLITGGARSGKSALAQRLAEALPGPRAFVATCPLCDDAELQERVRRHREARAGAGLRGLPFVCSWSGGKDSCLALHAAVRAGGVPRALLCMVDETGQRTRSHALPPWFVRAQADALRLPLMLRAATWADYEARFVVALQELAADGVRAGVFGDIDIESNRVWEEMVCAAAGLQPSLPLWGRARGELLEEVFSLGVRATIVTVDARVLGGDLVGRELEPAVVVELERAGADAAGELGEYHTAVTDGPLFAAPVPLTVRGHYRRGDHWHAELAAGDAAIRGS